MYVYIGIRSTNELANMYHRTFVFDIQLNSLVDLTYMYIHTCIELQPAFVIESADCILPFVVQYQTSKFGTSRLYVQYSSLCAWIMHVTCIALNLLVWCCWKCYIFANRWLIDGSKLSMCIHDHSRNGMVFSVCIQLRSDWFDHSWNGTVLMREMERCKTKHVTSIASNLLALI
jgi:hypothetical protein